MMNNILFYYEFTECLLFLSGLIKLKIEIMVYSNSYKAEQILYIIGVRVIKINIQVKYIMNFSADYMMKISTWENKLPELVKYNNYMDRQESQENL